MMARDNMDRERWQKARLFLKKLNLTYDKTKLSYYHDMLDNLIAISKLDASSFTDKDKLQLCIYRLMLDEINKLYFKIDNELWRSGKSGIGELDEY